MVILRYSPFIRFTCLTSTRRLVCGLLFNASVICAVSSCGEKTHDYEHPSNGGKYEGKSQGQFDQSLLLDSQSIGARTISVIQADQYQTFAQAHAKSSWTPVFNDRFSLTTAGSPPFPAHNGIPSYQPSLFHSLAPLAAIKPIGNSLTCNAQPYQAGCNTSSRKSLCQSIISDLNLGTKQDEAISTLYFYLIGEDISSDDLALLKKVAQAASLQTIYKDPLEIVCFTIMQTSSFLTL